MGEDRRLELRVSEEWLAGLDGARGGVPRGTFVKRVVEKALGRGPGLWIDPEEPLPDPPAIFDRPAVERVERAVAPRSAAPGRPVRREGESVVDFKIRLADWNRLNS